MQLSLLIIQLIGMLAEDNQLRRNVSLSMASIKSSILYFLVKFRNWKISYEWGSLFYLLTTHLVIGDMRCMSPKATTQKKSIFSIGMDDMPGSNTSRLFYNTMKYVCFMMIDKLFYFYYMTISFSNNSKQHFCTRCFKQFKEQKTLQQH